jgi:outer membrane receptor for monomeric catechols
MPDASTIERIEVLCGPAAMLYGRSDPSGIFNKPPQAQRRIVLSSQISNQGLRRGTLDANGTLDEQETLLSTLTRSPKAAPAITLLASATTSSWCCAGSSKTPP